MGTIYMVYLESANGRYIFVVLQNGGYFALCEVERYPPANFKWSDGYYLHFIPLLVSANVHFDDVSTNLKNRIQDGGSNIFYLHWQGPGRRYQVGTFILRSHTMEQ